MRVIDRIECQAFGHSPKQALRGGLIQSDQAWTALVGGKPAAMFGIVTVSAIEGLGRPWFLGTDAVYRHGREMLGMGPEILSRLLDSFVEARNLVSVGNGRAIRLLERWGFTVEEEAQMIAGTPFREFWIKRLV